MEKIKILFVEDLLTDVEIAQRALIREKINFNHQVVDTEENFEKALIEFQPHIIISDYAMPKFNGMSALKITRSNPTYIPFIMLTGSMNEETAVACMKAGADDYVIKEKIRRLPFSVREVLGIVLIKKEKEKALQDLLISEEKFRLAQEMSPDGFTILHPERNDKGEVVDFTWVYENRTIARINGTDTKDIIGKQLLDLFPSHRGTAVFETYLNVANTGTTQFLEEIYVGEIVSRPTWLRLVVFSMGTDIAILAQNITERKQAEMQLEQNLAEKNLLLRELYHRTKNNMQVILSMLKIQSRISNNDRITEIFNDISNKINAMSLVHQKLYEAQDLSHIQLKDYIDDLIRHLIYSYSPIQERIELKQDLEDIQVTIDKAVPLGFVLTELISNIFKHAFPEDRRGIISIKLYAGKSNKIILEISDNGVGIKDHENLREIKSMGLQNVFATVEHQLQGKIEWEMNGGLTWRIILDQSLSDKSRV